MGASNSLLNKFEEVDKTFKASLEATADSFQKEVFDLIMNASYPSAHQPVKTHSKHIPVLTEDDLRTEAQAKAEIVIRDGAGNVVESGKRVKENCYIELYSKKNLFVSHSHNKDFKDVQHHIDDYISELGVAVNNLVVPAKEEEPEKPSEGEEKPAEATEEGEKPEKADETAEGKEGENSEKPPVEPAEPVEPVKPITQPDPTEVIRSNLSNVGSLSSTIGSIIKSSFNIASVSSGVGITQNKSTTFLPEGVYLCTILYTSKAYVKSGAGNEVSSLFLCYTILATSTNLLRYQELLDNRTTDLVSRLALTYTKKKGELIGWSDALPKYISLTVTKKNVKAKCQKTIESMDKDISAMPVDKQPEYSSSELARVDTYAKAVEEYNKYGRYVGYKAARDFIASIAEDVETDEQANELLKAGSAKIKELNSTVADEYEKIQRTYNSALLSLRH